jgi:FkbH-like protein
MMASDSEQNTFFKKVTDLVKYGNPTGAMALLAAGIRNGGLDAEGYDRAGRLIKKIHSTSHDQTMPVRITVLGQCTTSWLSNMLAAVAWGQGYALEVYDGEYDNVMQEVMSPIVVERRPDVVVLMPWNQRLLTFRERPAVEQRKNDELTFWKKAWELITERMRSKILQVGYDWILPGALGHHLSGMPDGDVGLIRKINEELRNALPGGAFFLDLEQVSGMMGRERFYDFRRYYWTKQPFSEIGNLSLATHVWAGLRALLTGPKKVLVVDLDNTLWGGIVGETGPLGIGLGDSPDGEAYRSFQHYIKSLGQRGVVLSICSKNNREDAVAVFDENPLMVLALNDFAHVEVSWAPKSEGLRRIAQSLNLGLDTFVFFDDSPAERDEVKHSLPEVEVVDVPSDPADYVQALQAGLWFEAIGLSEADLTRNAQYQNENRRRETQRTFGCLEEYLSSLEMTGHVTDVNEGNLQRVVQLIAKTNQFNLTTHRHSADEVRRLLSDENAVGFVLTLQDKFGDYGLISVLLATPDNSAVEKTLYVDTWLMSCRVIGRTAELFLFNALLERAKYLGYRWILGEFKPTKKNALVADLFPRLGFSHSCDSAEGSMTYMLYVQNAAVTETFVRAPECARA